jgi:hypothetical protein
MSTVKAKLNLAFGLDIEAGSRLGDPTASDTLGTGLDTLDPAVGFLADDLQIRVPTPFGFVVCVRDIVAHLGAFSTYITYSGHFHSPLQLVAKGEPMPDLHVKCKLFLTTEYHFKEQWRFGEKPYCH